MQFKQKTTDFFLRKHREKINFKNQIQTVKKKIFLKKYYSEIFENQKIQACKSKIKNICLQTGLEKSTNLGFFNVSRHRFKKNMNCIIYPGMRKASW